MRYCIQHGIAEGNYNSSAYPHAYLLIWFNCKRYANPMTGALAFYDSTVGYEGQDADLTLALELLEEQYALHQAEEERIKAVQEQARERLGQQGK